MSALFVSHRADMWERTVMRLHHWYNYKNVTLVPALNFKMMFQKKKKYMITPLNSIFVKAFAVRKNAQSPLLLELVSRPFRHKPELNLMLVLSWVHVLVTGFKYPGGTFVTRLGCFLALNLARCGLTSIHSKNAGWYVRCHFTCYNRGRTCMVWHILLCLYSHKPLRNALVSDN